MTSFIKLHWEKVFSAAVEKGIALVAKQSLEREEFIAEYMQHTTGSLFWKRHYTRVEASDAYEVNMFFNGGTTHADINRAKDLENLAFQASKEYETDNDYVYLTNEDANFLFNY